MARTNDEVLAAIEKAAPVSSRSELARWMRRNHDALVQRLNGQRVDWTEIAKVFAKAGLTGRSGKPASPDSVRKAWERTQKAVAASRRAQNALPGPDATPEAVAAEPPRRRFQTAEPRGYQPSPAPTPTPEAERNVDEILAGFTRQPTTFRQQQSKDQNDGEEG
jgi:cell division septation protein DedD